MRVWDKPWSPFAAKWWQKWGFIKRDKVSWMDPLFLNQTTTAAPPMIQVQSTSRRWMRRWTELRVDKHKSIFIIQSSTYCEFVILGWRSPPRPLYLAEDNKLEYLCLPKGLRPKSAVHKFHWLTNINQLGIEEEVPIIEFWLMNRTWVFLFCFLFSSSRNSFSWPWLLSAFFR